MRAALLVVVLLAVTIVARPVQAQQGQMSVVRLEGRFGPPAPGWTSAADLTLELTGGKQFRFQASGLKVLDGTGYGSDFLDRVVGYTPSYFVRGPAVLLKQLAETRPDDRVAISANLLHGARTLDVSGVSMTPPSAVPPSAPGGEKKEPR